MTALLLPTVVLLYSKSLSHLLPRQAFSILTHAFFSFQFSGLNGSASAQPVRLARLSLGQVSADAAEADIFDLGELLDTVPRAFAAET